MTDLLSLTVCNRVAQVTINRPDKRNAMTAGMWAGLLTHVETIAQHPNIAAVMVTGSGGSFSAGADLKEVKNPDPRRVADYRRLGEQAVRALSDLPMPKLAAIDGPCLGAACSVALACDVRICTPRSQFGIPALRNGLTYEPVFLRRLVQVVGPGSAALLIYSGQRWDAAEATTRGLVDQCTDDAAAAVEQILDVLREVPTADIEYTANALRATAPAF